MMTQESMVVVKVGPAEVIVEIRGIPHLVLRRADLSAIESWIRNVGSIEPYYFIEFTTRHGAVTCDYKDRPLWEELLKKLAAAKLFDDMQGEATR
jgi:hypothetical protein